jgi:HK97 family phage major capsid protein
MPTVTELLQRRKKALEDAKEILSADDVSAEMHEQAERLIEDSKKIHERVNLLSGLEADAMKAAEALLNAEGNKDRLGTNGKERVTGFKGWGEFLQACHASGSGRYHDPRLRRWREVAPDDYADEKRFSSPEEKALAENVGATGGFLVPVEQQTEVYAGLAQENVVRQRATIIPMRRRQVSIPVLEQTDTTSGRPHWFGGMIGYWTEEAAEKTEDSPEFRQINLVAHKFVAYTRSSDELVEDSAVSLDAFLRSPMGMVGLIGWEEEHTFIMGTGAGQPLGVALPAPCTITVTRTADTINYIDLVNMLEAFYARGGRGCWHITQSAMANIITMSGPAGNPSYVWHPNAADGIPGFLLGMPVYWDEHMNAHGETGDVLLANWPYYLVGDRRAFSVESTQFDRWRWDETSWRAVHRVDGQPWLSAPLTYQDGTTQVSPFVILGAKAS